MNQDEAIKQRDELKVQMLRVQVEVQRANDGILDLTLYRARLVELGLLAAWDELHAAHPELRARAVPTRRWGWRRVHPFDRDY